MGFGSFVSHLVHPIIHAIAPIVANPLVQALQPEIAVPLSLATGGGVFGFGAHHEVTAQGPAAGNVPQPGHESPGINYYYQAPSYSAPVYPAYGGSPWDYSTPSAIYSAPSVPTYQAYSPAPMSSGRDRSWEDLILGSALFL